MKAEQFDFGAGLKELEEITAWFESEEVDLNQALLKFERGMELAATLKDHLKTVENRVEKIKQRFDSSVPRPEIDVSTDEPSPEAAPDLFSQA